MAATQFEVLRAFLNPEQRRPSTRAVIRKQNDRDAPGEDDNGGSISICERAK